MNEIEKDALSIARYMGFRYFHIAENIVIVHMPKNTANNTEYDGVDWLRIVISALFSFGVFRSIVQQQSFKTRISIYLYTVVFWLLCALTVFILILCLNGVWAYSILAAICSCLLSYAAFQMLNLEYKNLGFSGYTKDVKGIWTRSYRNEFDMIKSKWYLDFLLPVRLYIKHLRFLFAISNCKKTIDSSKLDVFKFLDASIKSSELLYVVKDNKLYRISCDRNYNIAPNSVYIKNANLSDNEVRVIAWTVLTALDMDAEDLDWVKESCSDEVSMYSWNKSIVAHVNGKPVGAIISYPGDDYEALRQYTWRSIWKDLDSETIQKTEVEAYPGEYYLDSMAILPEYRGFSIGKSLIEAAIEQGKSLGYNRFTLLVDCNKPRLKKYYESMGFNEQGKMTFFGHRYKRMMKDESK